MKYALDILLVASSAALLALAFPGPGSPHLAWIALVPLFLQLFRSGFLKAFFSALLAGFLFYLCLMGWAVRLDEANPWNFTAMNLYFAIYAGLFGVAARYLHERIPRWDALAFPSLWVAIEYLRSHIGFLSFPQGILGYSQYEVLPVAAISEYAGVYGVSFAIVSVNAALASIAWTRLRFAREGIGETRPAPIRVPLAIMGGVLVGISGVTARDHLSSRPAGADRSIPVAVVQGNAQADEKTGYDRYLRDVFPVYEALTLQAAASGSSLVVWPSSSVPGILPLDRRMAGLLASLANRCGAYLLIGSAGFDKFNAEQSRTRRVANSAFLFAPSGAIVGRYDKVRLLPFDEYLPLRNYVRWPSWIVSPGMTDHHTGGKLTIFAMDDVRFGVQICWENMFPDQVRKVVADGADFIVGQTNEFFAKSGDAQYQNLSYYVFRAVENRVPVVRSSANGVSCVIDPGGRIAAVVADGRGNRLNISGFAVARISLRPGKSFYNRCGDLFAFAAIVVVAGLGVYGYRGGKTDSGSELIKS